MILGALRPLITRHAYEQYRSRVEQTTKMELLKAVRRQLVESKHYYKDDFLQLDGVWWIYEVRWQYLILVTCYGRSDFDVPRALKWAKRHDDSIDLSGGRL